jgi:hypothetical protein
VKDEPSEPVLTTTWDLEDDDVAAVEAALGKGSLSSRVVRVSKGYSNKQTWAIEIDEAAVIKHLVHEAGELTASAQSRVAGQKTVADLRAVLDKLTDRTEGEEALLASIGTFRDGRPVLAALDVLDDQLPKFLYFDIYEAMPGRVAVEELISRIGGGETATDESEKIFLALLSLAGTSLDEIRDTKLSEALIAKLEGVSNFVSSAIFRYWSQNRHLKVQFRYDEGLPGDPAPYNTGHVFATRIENTRHGVTVRFDERSTGFVWFFSFLVWFSQMEKTYGKKLVILLDEPGLSLHGKAQADLLRYINEKLLPTYQVIYTTHSPFMIDAANVLSVRTVEDVVGADGELLGTKVGDRVLSTDADTLFPLRAALGYDITQSLFVGEHTFLVEGPSDLLYLRWASNELRAKGKTALDPRWTITPAGGVDKIGSFVALFRGNELDVAVLTDFHDGDKKKVRSLRDSELLRSGHVFTAEHYTGGTEADVEDLLGLDNYFALVNATYGLTGKHALKPMEGATGTTLAQVQAQMDTAPASTPAFDHYAPAAYLIEHSAELAEKLPEVDAALDRFEHFIKDVNAIL